jgi:hypothetical protein
MARNISADRFFVGSVSDRNSIALQKRPPTEAALLVFFRVKSSFFRLQTSDQFFDAIEHSPIFHSGRYAVEMLNLAVELDAFLTHC